MVSRAALCARADRVEPLADDLGGARRIAALERQVRELHGHLGGRLALLARAQEQRLGAIDLPGVDVAARQLEVDVGVACTFMSALWKRWRVSAKRCLQRVGLGEGGRVALGIQAQAQAQEVELDQLGGDAAR